MLCYSFQELATRDSHGRNGLKIPPPYVTCIFATSHLLSFVHLLLLHSCFFTLKRGLSCSSVYLISLPKTFVSNLSSSILWICPRYLSILFYFIHSVTSHVTSTKPVLPFPSFHTLHYYYALPVFLHMQPFLINKLFNVQHTCIAEHLNLHMISPQPHFFRSS